MNKLLLGTTAIIGASLLMAGAAYAAKPKVKVGGNLTFQIGGGTQDSEAVGTKNKPHRGYAFRGDSEFNIKASGKTDAGMKWSAKIEVEADTNIGTSIDESQLTFSGSWGRLVLGDEDGAEDLTHVGKGAYSSAGDGGVDGDWVKFVDWNGVNGRMADGPKMALDTGDHTKITYFTPRVGGLQGGVSFTPDTGADGNDLDQDNSGDFENSWGLGFNYKGKFDAVKVTVGAGAHIADAEDDFSSTTGVTTGLEDARAWWVGAEIGSGAWSVGGGYSDSGDGGEKTSNTFDDDSTSWHAGVGYKQGAVILGVSYLHAEVETSGGDDEGDVVAVSGTYILGGGAKVFADLFWFDTDDASDSTRDNEGYGFLVGAGVKF